MIENNVISTTEQQLYIVELAEPFERLAIQFMPNVRGSRVGNYSKVQIVGRNNPKYHFTGGEDSLRLDMEFMAFSELGDEVWKKIQWLKSLTANDAFNGPTHEVSLIFGRMYRNQRWIITRVDDQPRRFDHKKGMFPIEATVSINLSRVTERNLTIQDIRNQ